MEEINLENGLILDKHIHDRYKSIIDSGWFCSNGDELNYFRIKTSKNKDKYVYFHRFLMGDPHGFVVDHINRNTKDNRYKNLRIVSQSMNMFNTKDRKRDLPRGVYKKRSKFRAQIKFEGILHYLGVFETIEMAKKAYDEKKIELINDYNENFCLKDVGE